MATLHVRNVPDALYEALRENATVNGRSIGAELITVLERDLGASELDLGRARTIPYGRVPRRRGSSPFLSRFNARGRQAVVVAQEEAMSLEAAALAPEHLLLGLMREPETLASLILRGGGLSYEDVRATVEASAVPGGSPAGGGQMRFSPGAKKALELALRESINLRALEIGPEHLMLGVARAGEGVAAGILAARDLDVGTLRATLRSIEFLPGSEPGATPDGFRVVELSGEASDWERKLNEHAGRGHELVEIVDRRAIFRVPMSG